MAYKIKETKNMTQTDLLRKEDDSSENDKQRKPDKNSESAKRSRVNSRMKSQQTLQRLNQLRAKNEILHEKIQRLTGEIGFLKKLFITLAEKSQIELSNSVIITLRDTTSDILKNNLKKPQSSSEV